MSKEGVSGQVSQEQRLTRAMETVIDILTGKKLAAMKQQQERHENQVSSRLDELGRKLVAAEERTRKGEELLRRDLDKLSAGLSGLQLELQNQLESTERITGLLKNAATVFSGQPSGPSQAPAKGQNLESVVDNMFGTEDAQTDRDMDAAQEPSKKR